jgi:hypothetical protein
MSVPLESEFLLPTGSFLVALLVLVVLPALLVGGLVWLLVGRRGAAADR